MLKIKIIILSIAFLFISACGETKSENKLIAVKDVSELVGTWILGDNMLFIFTPNGYFDIRNIGVHNLNELDKGYYIRYYISNETLYTQGLDDSATRRGSPVYINSDRNIIYLYNDTNKLQYHKIDMNAVLKKWDEEFVRVTNASQILGTWIDKLDFTYTFYEDGYCDDWVSRKKYTIDNGNIYFSEDDVGYGNRMTYLSKDGSELYFNLRTNDAYHRK